MKTVGLRELKANLSRYVRAAAQGESLLITVRGRPLVELAPAKAARQSPAARLRARLMELGARPASKPGDHAWASPSNFGLKPKEAAAPGTAEDMIDAERGE